VKISPCNPTPNVVVNGGPIAGFETLLGRFDEHTHTITGAPSLKKKC